MFQHIALSLTALTVASASLFAQAPKEAAAPSLKAGMPAPALTVEKWVKGSPVASFEKGKVYVVEFWATWCGPCIASMPHLSALQREYKDKGVTIIGVTSKDSRGNSLDKVEKMVTQKADGMGYTVAWDTERKTSSAFMEASGQGGIPCSFLVDKNGTLAYIGHPMFLDEPLSQVVAGTWDIEKGNAALAKVEEEMNAVYEAAQDDPKLALEKITAFRAAHPKLGHLFDSMEFSMALQAEDFVKGYALGNKLVDQAIASKNAGDLNAIAWTIVDPEAQWKTRDLELALRAALEADEFSGGNDGNTLDTLARCYAWKGDMKKAIDVQTRAVGAVEGKAKEALQKTLDEYKAKGAQ